MKALAGSNPPRFGMALIVLAAVGCSAPAAVPSRDSPPDVDVLRIWVENPASPDSYLVAARSLAGKINACTDLEVLEVSGFEENIFALRVDPQRLQDLDATFQQVVAALGKVLPKGVKKGMRANSKDFTIELVSYRDTMKDDHLIQDVDLLLNPQVTTGSGASVPIAVLASVTTRPGRPPLTHQGVPALDLTVKTSGAQATLREVLKRFQSSHPDVRVKWLDIRGSI